MPSSDGRDGRPKPSEINVEVGKRCDSTVRLGSRVRELAVCTTGACTRSSGPGSGTSSAKNPEMRADAIISEVESRLDYEKITLEPKSQNSASACTSMLQHAPGLRCAS